MQTLIDISAAEEDFFVAILNNILAYKKESKKQIWDSSVCLSLNKWATKLQPWCVLVLIQVETFWDRGVSLSWNK